MTHGIWTLCDVFRWFYTSLALNRVAHSTHSASTAFNWIWFGVCALRVATDNKSWVCFTSTPTLRLCSAGNSSHSQIQWNTGKWYGRQYLLSPHHFTLFIFSLAVTVKGRTASLPALAHQFSRFLRNHFPFVAMSVFLLHFNGNIRNPMEFYWKEIRAFPIDLIFLTHISNLQNIFPPFFTRSVCVWQIELWY